ncbi:inactivation-no-after-potential D protein-like [Halyomorpha halys]|uniref:inactivation-no-after-potential D protein-like n=1 Tax=Halyomorpha halys TaxID=286706 RepID=UPI0006D4DE48
MAIVAELERGPQGLGISLAGHKDRTKMAVLICGLNPSTVVYRSTQGTLQVGDEIVEVNGVIVHGRCHLNASVIIKGLPGPNFTIIAIRKSDALEDLSVKPITQFPVSLQEETPEQKYSSFKGLKTVSIKKPGGSIERCHRGSSPSHQCAQEGLGVSLQNLIVQQHGVLN